MAELTLPEALVLRLERIYRAMEKDYDRVATQLSFSCSGCPDNCCDSYFLHHTYVEWAYLWVGFRQLSSEKQNEILARAGEAVSACAEALAQGQRPLVMCPLNEQGLCLLYPYRLLVCRTHGVPATMTRPDGKRLDFPGCFRCQDIVNAREIKANNLPRVERTPLLRELVMLENELLTGIRQLCPKVKMTIAEMLVNGPPTLLSGSGKKKTT
jgi:hypothetical protein